MKKIWALDFSQTSVTVAVAEAKPNAELRLLGSGQSPTQGYVAGDLESLGDAAEALVSALRKAEQSAGFRCENLFFNIDDPELEGCHSTGSKALTGEGQIRSEDLREAMDTALRMANRFDRSAVYSCATGFLMDGKDWVANPVGVFGRQLDVSMYTLLARAEHCERWQKVIERARLKRGIPVLSVLSASYGVLRPEDHPRTVLLWDLGRDCLNAAVVCEGILREALVLKAESLSAPEIASAVSARSKKIVENDPAIEETILTGDWAEKESLVERIRSQSERPLSVRAPWAVAGLNDLRQASLVGLLRLGAESHQGSRSTPLGKNLFLGLRQKAVSMINEYF